jgi:hypothetical protein
MNLSLFAKCVLLVAVSADLTLQAAAQNLSWAKNFNNLSDDIGRGITSDKDGNIYSVGTFDATLDFISPQVGVVSQGGYDGYLLKQRADGSTVWGKSFGGKAVDGAYAVAADKQGNVYVAGTFSDTANFDPGGSGNFRLVSAGGTDAFVLKVNAAGNVVWVKRIGGNGTDEGFGIATDAAGNVYVGGCFSNTADLDPGAAVASYTSKGYRDAFVEKLDGGGNLVWVAAMGGSMIDEVVNSVHIDAAGNVLTTGPYAGTVDFDPGAGVSNLIGSGTFIQKLSSSGQFIWAKSINDAIGYAVTTDGADNVIATGIFWSTGPGSVTDFDPGAGTCNFSSNGYNDAFVLKLSSAGNFAWARQMGGTAVEWAYGVAADAAGCVYSTGAFDGVVDFDPGSGVMNLTGDVTDIYVQKLDASGRLLWARRIGDHCADEGMGIALDANNNILVTGLFESAVDFDAGSGTCTLTANNGNDLFVLKMSQEATGIGKTPSLLGATIYPNPATTASAILAFPQAYNDISVTINDAIGRYVTNLQASQKRSINLAEANLVPGNYFVKVQTERGEETLRLQVQ